MPHQLETLEDDRPVQLSPLETVGSFNFLEWQSIYEEEKPFQIFADIDPQSPDQRTTNLVFKSAEMSVQDIRGRESDFKLDVHGFMIRQLPKISEDISTQTIESVYLPQVVNLLKSEVEDVERVQIYDWRMRHADAVSQDDTINLKDLATPLRPANSVHIDASPLSAYQRVQKEMGDKAAEFMQKRIRIINIWRPLSHAVEDWPLAVCDARSIKQSNLVETDNVRSGDVSSNMFAMYHPDYKWHYLHHQNEHEILVFKQFDNAEDVEARATLHASFKHTDIRPQALPRESIEVRALVF